MPIVLSSRLKDILIRINDDISRFVLFLEDNNDYTFQSTFLDITDDEGTISFLQSNKYQDIPKEKGYGDAVWTSSARNDIRVGRLINKIAPLYKSYEIEKWVNSFKAEFKNALKNIKFKIVDGDDLVKFYNGKRYSRGNGPLNKSCMRHDNCASYMDLYIKNSNKIKMVILLDGKEMISGRALLWKLDEPADTWLMDRIYVKEDSDVILFKKYAEKNKWFYKSAQTFDGVSVIKDGDEVNINMKVHVKGDYQYFPYIDTLLYYNKKDKYLTNSEKEYETVPNIIKLREINGGESGNENFVYDVVNREIISINDSVYCFYGDGYTHKNNAFFIKDFDEFVLPSEIRYSSYHKRFLTRDSSVFSKNLGSFVLEGEISRVYLTKDRDQYDFYIKNDKNSTYAIYDGNYYLMDILIKGIDGEYYFKDEYDENKILETREANKNMIEEIMKNSTYVRAMMGLDNPSPKKKKKLFA